MSVNMSIVLFLMCPKCDFSLEGNIKNYILISETKLKEGARVCKSHYSRLSRKPGIHWLLAEDICMSSIGQVKGGYCDGCPLWKALCAQVGSFEWFLMTAPGLEISSHQAFKSCVGKTKHYVLLIVCACVCLSVWVCM